MSVFLNDEQKEKLFNSESDFCSAVCSGLDGRDYDVGAVEAAGYTNDNISDVLARLMLMLLQRELLTKKEIAAVIEPGTLGYNKEGNFKWPIAKKIRIKKES